MRASFPAAEAPRMAQTAPGRTNSPESTSRQQLPLKQRTIRISTRPRQKTAPRHAEERPPPPCFHDRGASGDRPPTPPRPRYRARPPPPSPPRGSSVSTDTGEGSRRFPGGSSSTSVPAATARRSAPRIQHVLNVHRLVEPHAAAKGLDVFAAGATQPGYHELPDSPSSRRVARTASESLPSDTSPATGKRFRTYISTAADRSFRFLIAGQKFRRENGLMADVLAGLVPPLQVDGLVEHQFQAHHP